MANNIDIVKIANQLFGKSSSVKAQKNSYQNQPGNLPGGSTIPGTNIKQGSGYSSVARKGRKGDTRLNVVDGELSHVNAVEDEAINKLGPVGEAFTKSVGSGTINPETGLREYSWLSARLTPSKKMKKAGNTFKNVLSGDASLNDLGKDIHQAGKHAFNQYNGWIANKDVAWRPSQGKWGIFGQTEGAKKADAKKKVQKSRQDAYRDAMVNFKDANIAGMQTPDTNDTPGVGNQFEGDFEGFIQSTGISNDMDDIDTYIDKYDSRNEDELVATTDRTLQSQNINAQVAGDNNSAGMFGLLTQSNTNNANQNFAGSGNFAMDFSKKQAIDKAEAELDSSSITREETLANLDSGTADLHDAYNEEFWEQMGDWNTQVNS